MTRAPTVMLSACNVSLLVPAASAASTWMSPPAECLVEVRLTVCAPAVATSNRDVLNAAALDRAMLPVPAEVSALSVPVPPVTSNSTALVLPTPPPAFKVTLPAPPTVMTPVPSSLIVPAAPLVILRFAAPVVMPLMPMAAV